MPRFPLDHGLVHRGYEPTPELYALVKTMVPQQPKEAQAFLSKEENRNAVVSAIKRLPCLGTQESEEQYGTRLADEFGACREIYETRLGVSPVSFCWPWGSYTSVLLREAEKAGFRFFFTTLPGVNPYGKADAVCRIAVRGGSGRELLGRVRTASSTLLELPYELYRRGSRLAVRFTS
jgi:hypothetical protein